MMQHKIDAVRRRTLEKFQERLGVQFKNIALLDTALTHSSYTKEHEGVENYERMEFLGDALLGLSSAIYLYENFPDLAEGELTVTRANVVCGATLSRLSKNLGIGRVLLLSESEEANDGRKRASNLEDAFESVIAAIYLDQGWEAARNYVWRQLAPEFKNVKIGNVEPNFKSELQEYIQGTDHTIKIEYFEISEDGPPHDRTFECGVKLNGEIYGTGVGKSKQAAEKIAASVALKKLNVEV